MARRQPSAADISAAVTSNVGVVMSGIPAVKNIVENIRHMRERALDNVTLDMIHVAGSMERRAQDLAHRVYESHYERHPSERYPNEEVAADSISGRAHRTGETVFVALSYTPDVIQTVGTRAPITYGGILEAEVHGQTAVITPTWEDFQMTLLATLQGSFVRYGNLGGSPGTSRKLR